MPGSLEGKAPENSIDGILEPQELDPRNDAIKILADAYAHDGEPMGSVPEPQGNQTNQTEVQTNQTTEAINPAYANQTTVVETNNQTNQTTVVDTNVQSNVQTNEESTEAINPAYASQTEVDTSSLWEKPTMEQAFPKEVTVQEEGASSPTAASPITADLSTADSTEAINPAYASPTTSELQQAGLQQPATSSQVPPSSFAEQQNGGGFGGSNAAGSNFAVNSDSNIPANLLGSIAENVAEPIGGLKSQTSLLESGRNFDDLTTSNEGTVSANEEMGGTADLKKALAFVGLCKLYLKLIWTWIVVV